MPDINMSPYGPEDDDNEPIYTFPEDGPECTDEDYQAAERETQEQSRNLANFRANLNDLTYRINRLRYLTPPVYGPVEPPRTYTSSSWFSTNFNMRWDRENRLAAWERGNTWEENAVKDMYRPFNDKPEKQLDNRQRVLRLRRTQKDLDLEDSADRAHYQDILDTCQRHTLNNEQYRTRFAYVGMESAFSCLKDRMGRNEFDLLSYTQEHIKYLKDNTRFIFAWRGDITERANVEDAKTDFTAQLTRMFHAYYALILVVRMQRQQGHANFCLPLNIKELFADGLESYYAAWENLYTHFPKYMWKKFDLLSRFTSY